jgi:hypothetical protein
VCPNENAICSVIVEQHREALHRSPLTEAMNPYNPEFKNAVNALANSRVTAVDSHALAITTIARTVARQATFLASLDGFVS